MKERSFINSAIARSVSERKEKNMEENRMKGGCCDHIKGIKCNVKNCYYHDCDTYCTAKQIAVGPQSAESSAETLCATFKPKEQ